ncbi:MAG: hypothetical protein G3M78_14020 [Candidatus Nitrohelix vancouverensis]|uniref:Uncharacterized protein n=1 Tax=Candidatus Nitrohelix vancouverensis TaxID=2705534 RepID=A0A7T0C4J0_9BACT|nr:MAG: hypothetical protein G3M78_14020 [Candidatus Nitrohelix vancouverensis]
MQPVNEVNEHSNAPSADPKGSRAKFWRNLFAANFLLSLFLIGLFWFPQKFSQLENFFNSPSVNLPQKVDASASQDAQIPEEKADSRLLPTRYAIINASNDEKYVYFDFSTGKQVDIFDKSSIEWDLALRRSKIISNGGATNQFGKAGLYDLGEVDFDSVEEVPTEDYVTDIPTRTETENPVLMQWYKYNFLTHKLTPKKNIYAIRTADNKFVKIQFISFYCDNDETGCIRIQYAYQDNGSNSFLKTETAQTSPSKAAQETLS